MNTEDIFNIESSFFTEKVTISLEKRNGKKCITNVIDMAEDLDLKNIVLFEEDI